MPNAFFIIILAAILLDFALDVLANVLNLRELKLEPPAGLEGVYKPEEYRRSQEYTRVATRFDFVSSTFSLAVLLVFWFSGGFNFLDSIVRSWGFNPLVNGLLYAGILAAAYGLIGLPFSVYETFGIEARFGFNRTTPRTFIMDLIKGAVLGALLGSPVLAAVLLLFQYAGAYAWLYVWAAVTLFSLAVSYVAPTWIMPLFNKFTPMEPGELRDAILSYAKSVDFPVRNVFVMDGSKRSTRGNAFFTGFGRNKRIALYDTLIAKHTVGEMVGVLAHEIGHHKKKHIMQGMIIGVLHSGLVLFLVSIFIRSQGLYQAFFMQQSSIYAGLIFFGLLYTPLEFVIGIFSQMLSRHNEREADIFAAETTGHPQDMIDALKKLSADNLSNLSPHPFFVFLNYSHPPLKERIENIRKSEKTKN
ncbi:MAG: M48 family metallopeptidase [Dehalococcoidales bacterium]|nr:M48 family metallopeptidase [Dehalococcoidales bacterium]